MMEPFANSEVGRVSLTGSGEFDTTGVVVVVVTVDVVVSVDGF
jgi:hypothetical protein